MPDRASCARTPPENRRRRSRRWSCFELLERSRPILLEESRHRAVGEQTTICLTALAIVRLVVRVPNALHRCAADRTWLLESSVHSHPVAKCRHLLGEGFPGLIAEAIDPFA